MTDRTPRDAPIELATTRPVNAMTMPARTEGAHELVAEVPIAVVFDGSSAAVMMASPANVEDFATGFALTEGFISNLDEVTGFEEVRHEKGIEARFWLREELSEKLAARRRSMAGPVGCGLCGLESLDEAARDVPKVAPGALHLSYDDLNKATHDLRAFQPMHDKTRAVHGAGFLEPGKGITLAREDVGRHNALDKLIGAMARSGVDPASGAVVMTSRISVELVQKAAIAGAPMIVAVSAPTAYAVDVAEAAGVTLAAFSRGSGFEVFSHPERLAAAS